VAALADSRGLREVSFHMLRAASAGGGIPPALLEALRPRYSLKNYLIGALCLRGGRTPFADYLADALVNPRQAVRALFPPASFMRDRYGVGALALPFLYLTRPVVLALKCAAGLAAIPFSKKVR
jgi:hypothetical protein